jgi:hypothetical protein
MIYIKQPEETGGLAAQWYKQWRKAGLEAKAKKED